MVQVISQTFDIIRQLVAEGNLRISDHGYDQLSERGISSGETIAGLRIAILVEDYPDHWEGPAVLVLSRDNSGYPIHSVWGIPKGKNEPAVLVTAYRPNPEIWNADFTRRKQ